jgi:hypothetical protein
MTGGWRPWTVSVLAVMMALGACSSPPPALYTIAPVDGATVSDGPKVVLLQQIALARYLERSQIVRSSENYQLDVMANDWWGEPLGAMLSRVLVDELGQRLPQSVVLSENGAVSSPADATIELNLRRLDEDAAGNLILTAQAGVTFKGHNTPALRSFRFVVQPKAAGVTGEVAAISDAVGQLASGLASVLRAGPAAH